MGLDNMTVGPKYGFRKYYCRSEMNLGYDVRE